MKKILLLIICIGIPLSAGFLGSIATSAHIDSWYMMLNKPVFNPPNWVFAPVWTLLYIMMGVSLYIFLKVRRGKNKKLEISVFALQIILNVLWSYLFFYLQNPLLALVEILILLAVIIVNIYLFYREEKLSGLLLIPYALWVAFASFLTYSIVILN